MEIKKVIEQAEKHGDFYMYYRKHTGKGTTYLVGTTNFDNSYIQNMALEVGNGVPAQADLGHLQKVVNQEGKILVFSWTNNKFRVIPASHVRRLTPLSAELRNGRKR